MCPLPWGSVISEADTESDGFLSEIPSPFRDVRSGGDTFRKKII